MLAPASCSPYPVLAPVRGVCLSFCGCRRAHPRRQPAVQQAKAARALHFARLVLGIVCRQTHHVFLLSLSSGRRFPNIVSRTRVLSVASD